MKTFVEYLKEHPTITQRIAKKINPAEVIRDKLKSARGATKRNLQKALDKVNPLSDFNKAKTMAKKKDRAGLVKQRAGLKAKTKDVQNKIDKIDGVER
tara:strand:- start:38 stop:331 length:294 start_codon:yes stop_codon:yes gene_type:complete